MACGVWTWIVQLCIFARFLNLCATQTVHKRNVALNQSCGLSSQYVENFTSSGQGCTLQPVCVTGNCSAVINGNEDTTFYISGNPPNCIHTDQKDMTPYWWVDLGQAFVISNIIIFERKIFLSRMVCVNVSIDGQLVKRFTDQSGWVSERYDIPVRRKGKVINITRDCSFSENDGPTMNICEVQVWVCDDGWYGDCTHTCGHCAGSSTCDKVNGSCTACNAGFQPILCQECIDGRYGDNCTQTCGNCAEGAVCDKVNGGCNSCRPGFQPPLCKACTSRLYGENCTQTCGHCAGNSVCDNGNGSCASCETGFHPPLCKVCEDGLYGGNCTQTCGNCVGDFICDKETGSCTSCKTGFKLPECKDIMNLYRPAQSQKIYQLTAKTVTSTCQTTVKAVVEDVTTRVTRLTARVSVYQAGRLHCVNFTGCTVGLWGDSCSRACGDGCENRTCDTVDGTCTCMNGWIAPRCEVNSTYVDGKLWQSNGTPVGAIAGPVLAVIAAAVIVAIVLLVVRRRRQHKGRHSTVMTRTENTTASETVTNVSPSQGMKPIAEVKPQKVPQTAGKYDVSDFHVYSNFSEDTQSGQQSVSADHGNQNVSASDTIQSASSIEGKNEGHSRPVATLAQEPGKKGAVDARVYENVDLKATVSSISDARRSKGSSGKPSEDKVEVANLADDDSDGMHNTDDVYASYRSLGPSSILDEFQKCLLACLASGKLGMEFVEFSKSLEYPHEIGSKPENSKNNRFKALFAYDHSRVVLRRPKGDNNTDYINANYIKGCHREKTYIATQGPRVNTVDDLWWMVWQENATQIVMLTNIKECGKDKCEEYWPSVGETRTFGHVAVTALNIDTRAHFVVRKFLLSSQKVGEQREVSQFHYLAWPDHGVPSSFSLVNFWRYVKSRATGAIPIVHCSAGVGRTGTYIGLDIAFDLRSSGRDVNVKDIVTRLRQDRTLMVQTEEQYKFLHEAILEEYTSRASRMTFEQFDAVFPDTITPHNTRIKKEFEILKQMGDFVLKPNHTIAGSNENISKNRNTELLPEDSFLAYLTEYMPGENQYINAVQMSSFRKPNGLILTQLPLPDTVVDLWRLVHGCDVNTIVSIGHKEQRTSIKNYCAYWPETEKDVLRTGPYVIRLRSKSALGDHVTCYNLSLTKKASTSREIRVLYYDDWKGVVPGSISDILQLTEILESWHVDHDNSPIIVQCSDGVERSGMFCVLYDVINRVRHDQEIDVYIRVRQVRSVRRQAVTTEVMQYSYCYKVAQACKRQESVYQNT